MLINTVRRKVLRQKRVEPVPRPPQPEGVSPWGGEAWLTGHHCPGRLPGLLTWPAKETGSCRPREGASHGSTARHSLGAGGCSACAQVLGGRRWGLPGPRGETHSQTCPVGSPAVTRGAQNVLELKEGHFGQCLQMGEERKEASGRTEASGECEGHASEPLRVRQGRGQGG